MICAYQTKPNLRVLSLYKHIVITMKYLLAVGACYLDTVLNVEHYPTEDDKLRASSLLRRRGDNSPNTLEVLQQLVDLNGLNQLSLVLSAVLPSSSSPGAQQIISSFGSKVDLTHCVYREDCNEPASSSIIRSSSTDSRTLINYNELPEMTSKEFTAIADELGNEISWCHFEGRIPEVTLECMRYLRQHFPSVRISAEIEKPARAGLQDLAAVADVVFYSKSWAQGNGYTAPEDCLRAQAAMTPKASLLFCTWGRDGVSVLELPSSDYMHCPAYVAEGADAIERHFHGGHTV